MTNALPTPQAAITLPGFVAMEWERKHTVIPSLIFDSIKILARLEKEVIFMENLLSLDTQSGTLPRNGLADWNGLGLPSP